MRIGMMADAYKPYVSGITNYIDLNKRTLESAGHEVFVFTFGDMDYQDDEPRVFRSPGVPLADTGFYLSLRYKTAVKKLRLPAGSLWKWTRRASVAAVSASTAWSRSRIAASGSGQSPMTRAPDRRKDAVNWLKYMG